MRIKSVWLVLAMAIVLLSPTLSFAAEVDYLDSFGSGFDTLLGNGVNEVVTPERDYNESYEPSLEVVIDEQLRANDEEPTLMQSIQQTVRRGMIIQLDGTNWVPGDYYYGAFRAVLLLVAPIAVLLVFMWWGVRKSLRMLFAAFRKGRSNV